MSDDATAAERAERWVRALRWGTPEQLINREPPPCPFRGCDLDHDQENPQSP